MPEMTTAEWTSNVIAALALIVAGFALYRSSRENVKANELRGGHLMLHHGQAEMDLHKLIQDARNRVEDFLTDNGDFLARPEGGLLADDKRKRERLVAVAKSNIEGYLSALDSACRKYRDGKIDKDWFKREHQTAIRQAVKADEHEEFLRTGHEYHALMAVYDEWENPEKRT